MDVDQSPPFVAKPDVALRFPWPVWRAGVARRDNPSSPPPGWRRPGAVEERLAKGSRESFGAGQFEHRTEAAPTLIPVARCGRYG
jgi:hypothetical protein